MKEKDHLEEKAKPLEEEEEEVEKSIGCKRGKRRGYKLRGYRGEECMLGEDKRMQDTYAAKP
ncbi:hypothetical protein T08_6835 [Trichinella sp. T8]|nr:hypothetical protein T08_6835 [Trichinella sp. T8]